MIVIAEPGLRLVKFEEAGCRSCNRRSTERVDIARKSYEKDNKLTRQNPHCG
jgi:hypothetical protein